MTTAIVIAANRVREVTRACLDSLDEHTDDFRLFFYDRVPEDELTKAWNAGARQAWRFGCEAIVICNNDVEFTPGWLPPLIAHLDAYKAVGPVTNRPGHQPLQRGRPGEEPRYQEIRWSGGEVGIGVGLNGFCFASSTSRILSTPFDEIEYTFMGSEDYWMRLMGGPFAIARHSYVHHVKGATRWQR